jgi:hypothetical protein
MHRVMQARRRLWSARGPASGNLPEDQTAALMRLIKFRPPAEGLLFFRAVAGCVLNVRAIGARGELRPVFEELTALAPAAT